MGDAALHLDLFEQPGRGRDSQNPAMEGNPAIRQLGNLDGRGAWLPSCLFLA
jgi:hypothetical protein